MEFKCLTNDEENCIMYVSRVIALGKGGKQMKMKVIFLRDVDITLRKINSEWILEEKLENGTVCIIKEMQNEPSVSEIRKILKERYYPNSEELVLKIID